MELKSTITGPHCGTRKQEGMPADACQFFYGYQACGEVLKAREETAVYTAPMALNRVLLCNRPM